MVPEPISREGLHPHAARKDWGSIHCIITLETCLTWCFKTKDATKFMYGSHTAQTRRRNCTDLDCCSMSLDATTSLHFTLFLHTRLPMTNILVEILRLGIIIALFVTGTEKEGHVIDFGCVPAPNRPIGRFSLDSQPSIRYWIQSNYSHLVDRQFVRLPWCLSFYAFCDSALSLRNTCTKILPTNET